MDRENRKEEEKRRESRKKEEDKKLEEEEFKEEIKEIKGKFNNVNTRKRQLIREEEKTMIFIENGYMYEETSIIKKFKLL